jgi:hypothetical protein
VVKVSECLKEMAGSIESYFFSAYLRRMEHKDLVLVTLAQMVAESAQPTLYQFIPRELILRMPIDWSIIFSCLTALEEEGAVQIFHADTIQFSITEKGIELSKHLNMQTDNSTSVIP